MCLPSNYIIFKLGMRRSMMLSCGLFFAGCSVKLLSTLSIYFVHVGQFICGLGTPLVLNMIGKFAAHWFYKNARSVRKFSLTKVREHFAYPCSLWWTPSDRFCIIFIPSSSLKVTKINRDSQKRAVRLISDSVTISTSWSSRSSTICWALLWSLDSFSPWCWSPSSRNLISWSFSWLKQRERYYLKKKIARCSSR